MTALYKYGAMAGMLLALLIGVYLFGLHQGSADGRAIADATVARINAASALEIKQIQQQDAAQAAAVQAQACR